MKWSRYQGGVSESAGAMAFFEPRAVAKTRSSCGPWKYTASCIQLTWTMDSQMDKWTKWIFNHLIIQPSGYQIQWIFNLFDLFYISHIFSWNPRNLTLRMIQWSKRSPSSRTSSGACSPSSPSRRKPEKHEMFGLENPRDDMFEYG